jgi:hypothetical protein
MRILKFPLMLFAIMSLLHFTSSPLLARGGGGFDHAGGGFHVEGDGYRGGDATLGEDRALLDLGNAAAIDAEGNDSDYVDNPNPFPDSDNSAFMPF